MGRPTADVIWRGQRTANQADGTLNLICPSYYIMRCLSSLLNASHPFLGLSPITGFQLDSSLPPKRREFGALNRWAAIDLGPHIGTRAAGLNCPGHVGSQMPVWGDPLFLG